MADLIHPTAILDPSAQLGTGVKVGPYALIGPNVVLGDGVEVGHGTTIEKNTRIGAGTRIWPQAVLGVDPQDLKYRGEDSTLEIGERCMIREFTSLHRGTAGGGMVTQIGNDVLVMNGVHVGHDAQVGNHCIIAAHSALGGHVLIEDHAVIGGISGIHQWVRVGAHAMVGLGMQVTRDVPPYAVVEGKIERLTGVNMVGLKRRGFSKSDQRAIFKAMGQLFLKRGEPSFAEAIAQARQDFAGQDAVQVILDFIDAGAADETRQRGYARP